MTTAGRDFDLKQDHFELFGLPRRFDIDLELLSRRFFAIQKDVHPDRFASATEAERRLSVQYATLVNQAHEVLRSPVRRGLYLLRLLGVDLPEETTGSFSQDFLMQQMMLRERLEGLDSAEEVDGFKSEVLTRQEKLEGRLTDLLAASDLEGAAECLRRMQFVDKLSRDVKLQEERLLNEY